MLKLQEIFIQELMNGFSRVYHVSHNDLDGVSPIVLTKLAFPNIRTKVVANGGPVDIATKEYMDVMGKEDLLVLTDLSPSLEVAGLIEEKIEEGYKIILFDHHKSAMPIQNPTWTEIVVEQNSILACGTSLYADFLTRSNCLSDYSEAAVETYVELVRSWDTWDWSRTGNLEAKKLNTLFYLIGIKEYIAFVMERVETGTFSFGKEYEQVLKLEEKKIELEMSKREKITREFEIDGEMVGIVHCENYHSEVGHYILDKRAHLDYVVLINLEKRTISLRSSDGGRDVQTIAKTYGGGGHPNAAGCEFKEETIEKYVSPYLNRILAA